MKQQFGSRDILDIVSTGRFTEEETTTLIFCD